MRAGHARRRPALSPLAEDEDAPSGPGLEIGCTFYKWSKAPRVQVLEVTSGTKAAFCRAIRFWAGISDMPISTETFFLKKVARSASNFRRKLLQVPRGGRGQR